MSYPLFPHFEFVSLLVDTSGLSKSEKREMVRKFLIKRPTYLQDKYLR